DNTRTTDTAKKNPKQFSPAKIGFVYDDIYLQHQTPPGFPERPQRLSAIVERLKQENLLARLMRPTYSMDCLKWISTIHSTDYIERVKQICQQGKEFIDSEDVPVSQKSFDVAVAAVGGVIAAVDAVVAQKCRSVFCAIRPPGHHALKNKAMGFCIFNNVSIAAKYIQKQHNRPKVLIVDWDVHHGNGTQAAFYEDPSVLYFSVHQYPFYPGTGAADERGTGKSLGFTVNVPLPAGSDDKDYQRVFEEKLVPVVDPFQPDFVLISAGFDAHIDDPIGGMKVTAKGFARLTKMIMQLAAKHCQGRIVSILEGGYNLKGLADSVEAHIRSLMG
ncbi:MAG: histone deacetylase family protein, partial [Planctomycetota bacterium]